MKTKPSGHWHFEPSRHTVTRNRAAYLLRAARSHRRGNVLKRGKGNYRLADCRYSLFTA